MDTLIQDLPYGIRTLLKNRAFTAVAVITLALGIGANTAIFSAVNAMLIQPLPFQDSDKLMTVWRTNPRLGYPQLPFSYPDFNDFKQQSETFEDVAAWSINGDTRFNLTGADAPEQIQYAI